MSCPEYHQYSVTPFDRDIHDRTKFSCGDRFLDQYLKERANQDFKKKIAVPFVLIEPGESEILGYYTLSSSSMRLSSLPPEIIKQLPKYPRVPATLIGRLAVHEECQGNGLGEYLLMDALFKSLWQSKEIASYAVVVDAKDEKAKDFYLHFDFTPLPKRRRRLFLPMETVRDLMGGW